MKLLPAPLLVGLTCLILCHSVPADEPARVIPRPQIEDHGRGLVQLGLPTAKFKASFKNINPAESAAGKEWIPTLVQTTERCSAAATPPSRKGGAKRNS